jgi:RNA polymerase sigma-70 factor (ECF subfamily)
VPVELADETERAEPAGASSDLHTTEDATLVAAAKKGEAAAFAMLVERYERRIVSAALRITHNREDAEDVMQQSFQKAFVHLQEFAGKSSFSTWLTRIAINEALMFLRRSRRLREVPLDDANANEDAATAVEIPDSSPDPELSYSQRERERILFSAMNELNPGMRKAIELRELGGLSTLETARAMDLSVPAVKSRVFHGRQKLRKRLRRYLEVAWISGSKTLRTGGGTKGVPQEQLACNACG